MKLELEIYNAMCATSIFVINGINADQEDFGTQGDNDPDEAEPYGCGNMVFERVSPSSEVLKKYNITKEEYSEVCDKLEAGLSFGECGWCV